MKPLSTYSGILILIPANLTDFVAKDTEQASNG